MWCRGRLVFLGMGRVKKNNMRQFPYIEREVENIRRTVQEAKMVEPDSKHTEIYFLRLALEYTMNLQEALREAIDHAQGKE